MALKKTGRSLKNSFVDTAVGIGMSAGQLTERRVVRGYFDPPVEITLELCHWHKSVRVINRKIHSYHS